MMSRRALGYLAGALVVLVGLSLLTSKKRYATAKEGGFASVFDAKLDTAQIQSIKAWLGDQPDSSVVLERAGEGWTIPTRYGWPAKSELVKQLMDDLAGMKGELRSSDPKVLADYQIDDEKGLHVVGTSSAGQELFHLVSGKSSPQGGSFVRREGSNDVFVTRAGLRSSFGVWGDTPRVPDPKRWIDLAVHKAERNDVDKMILTSGGQALTLEKVFAPAPPAAPDTAAADSAATPAAPSIDRTNWTWKKDAKGELDKNRVDAILGTLCSLYAAEVADPAKEADHGFGPGARVAELVFTGGKTTRIEFGRDTDDGKRVFIRIDGGRPAEIYKSSVDRIFQARKELSPQKA
jgi:hypothetical protein